MLELRLADVKDCSSPLVINVENRTTTPQSQSQSQSQSQLMRLFRLFAFPTTVETKACWELCRLHNNIGFWVIWLPTAWSIAMLYHAQPQLSGKDVISRAVVYVPLCFGIKSLIMTIDDLFDYDVDVLVERTKYRPIPRGAISLPRAWIFFGMQVVLGLGLAVTFLGPKSLNASMLVWPLYIIYPTCKRWTYLAPIPLGLMFKIGIFMGWNDLSLDDTSPRRILVPLYVGACMWTFTYETVYQHQDKVDDVKVGIKSPALLLGGATIPICTMTAFGFLSLLTYSGTINGNGLPFYVGVAVAGMLLLFRLLSTDIDRPEDCKRLFLGTPMVGQVILAGLVLDAIFQRVGKGIPL